MSNWLDKNEYWLAPITMFLFSALLCFMFHTITTNKKKIQELENKIEIINKKNPDE
jgi:hypothetical protein